MSDTPPALAVTGLTRRFGAATVVDGLDFTVAAGHTVALLGGNGAGKTTTIAMLLGLLTPSAGAIRVFGLDLARHRHRALARMNFSSPYVDLPHRLSVQENLDVYAGLYNVPDRAGRIARLTAELDLTDFLDRPAGRLSAGQKTRVALAKAMINEPDLLLLDEPTASLDPDTGDRMRALLEHFRTTHGTTILLASHNMAEVERLADDVLMLRRGRIVARGAPADLIQRYGRRTMEEVFLDIHRHHLDETVGAPPQEAAI